MSATDGRTESPQEALENFEKATIWNHITGSLPEDDEVRIQAVNKYETAKAELLVWLSYIP